MFKGFGFLPGLFIRVHFHHLRVYGGIQDYPGAAAKFSIARNVHEDGLLIVAESIDDEGAIFKYFFIHV